MSRTLVPVGANRQLAVGRFGDPDGVPVFFFHGALASWRYRHPDDGIAARLGVRLITAARPGFGESTRNRGRTVADWATDVASLADRLGIDRFGVLGHSGGGPHALACGALLADRVTAVGAAGSLAPFVDDDRFVALGPTAEGVYRAARGDLTDLEDGLGRVAALVAADAEQAVRGLLAGEAMPEIEGLVELLADDARDALAAGVGGWADELHALVRDWGFALDHPHVPTTLWYGEDDQLRIGHGEPLAAALGVTIAAHRGGHLAVFDHWADALRTIASADSRS